MINAFILGGTFVAAFILACYLVNKYIKWVDGVNSRLGDLEWDVRNLKVGKERMNAEMLELFRRSGKSPKNKKKK